MKQWIAGTCRPSRRSAVRRAVPLLFALGLLVFAPSAASAKEVVYSFGEEGAAGGQFGFFNSSSSGYSDVNTTGAGPGNPGDLYIADTTNDRIQRFSRDDKGTPGDRYDDTFEFVSAWGADVDANPAGGGDYEICTVATECQPGAAAGGNGTVAGNGVLSGPVGIAVDEDTGQVYVADVTNNRVNVYAGDGLFLRSFGFDVVASGPGDNGSGYEVCVAAAGDVCKAGTGGGAVGQAKEPIGIAVSQADGNPASGTVFLTDSQNSRINTYGLDGSGPGSFGSAADIPASNRPRAVTVDSRGIVYFDVMPKGQQILRYDTENANGTGIGFLEPIPTATVAVAGGPGDSAGSNPYILTFKGALRRTDVSQLTVSNGSTPLTGGSGATLKTVTQGSVGEDEVQQLTVSATAGTFRLTFDGQTTGDIPFFANSITISEELEALSSVPAAPIPASSNNGTIGLSVDPDSDGPGPDQDVLYALRTASNESVVRSKIYQLGPANAPGLTAPPPSYDDIHGDAIGFTFTGGLGLDRATGQLFVATSFDTDLGYVGTRVYLLDVAGGSATASLDSVSDITASSAVVNATIDPNGPPLVSYHVEYSLDGSKWSSTPEVVVGTQETPQSIAATLAPAGSGLDPGTLYHVRLAVTKAFNPPIITGEKTFTTALAAPEVETVGSPLRTATTAMLEGRVNPRGSATTYHFEYGDAGPCDSNPCQATVPVTAGSGSAIRLVAQRASDLVAGTVYHYRIVADNGIAGSPKFGEDMTVRTRADDDPLAHGRFAGPSGSDRAWELVSLPDNGGNPVTGGLSFSNDGSRAIYQGSGGSAVSDSGTSFSMYFADRTPTGWQSKQLSPPRDQLIGVNWFPPTGNASLSELFILNFDPVGQRSALWRLQPNGEPSLLHNAPPGQYGGFYSASDDGSRNIVSLKGSVDPSHPAPPGVENLYDISSGTPQLISLLPGDIVPACGVTQESFPVNAARRPTRWLSPQGSLLVFPARGSSCGPGNPADLYLRDLIAEETFKISGPPLSGALCDAEFVKQTPGGVFFITGSRLSAEDTAADGCSGKDVYRYDIGEASVECVTCLTGGLAAKVASEGAGGVGQLAVAGDGSRVYFVTSNRLLPGVVTPAAYRVDVESGELAYVGPVGEQGSIGDSVKFGSALSSDGSVLIFRSSSAALNTLNGPQNGGTAQYYRYDDDDRSLVCVSCPQDGSMPAERASTLASGSVAFEVGPNADPLDDDGDTFVFSTPNSLAPPDQNTVEAGQNPAGGLDVYEWRDGRVLLVSDGLTHWPNENVAPAPSGVSSDGRDVFFTAAAQYTPDALDGYNRLYDARIGGGIDFPVPPKPCPLEVCQGTPKGAPQEEAPGSSSFFGQGNKKPPAVSRRCPKGKRQVRRRGKARCVSAKSKKGRRQANDHRRTQR